MRFTMTFFALVAAVAVRTAPAVAVAPSPPPIDCTRTAAAMDPSRPPAPTGDLDRDTAAIMRMHVAAAMEMARIEAACGRDPKRRAQAQSIVDDALDLVNRIDRLTGPNG